MDTTPFPATPGDVVALTIQEFTFARDVNNAPSLDEVCNRFVNDMNRALVWVIRFRALQTWCGRAENDVWLRDGFGSSWDAGEVAASFNLNGDWEFADPKFRRAVESVISRRLRRERA